MENHNLTNELENSTFDFEDIQRYQHVMQVFRIENYSGLLSPIPEETIIQCWMEHSNKKQNDYDQVVERGRFYRKHGLTPAYLSDPSGMMLIVTSQEHIENKLH